MVGFMWTADDHNPPGAALEGVLPEGARPEGARPESDPATLSDADFDAALTARYRRLSMLSLDLADEAGDAARSFSVVERGDKSGKFERRINAMARALWAHQTIERLRLTHEERSRCLAKAREFRRSNASLNAPPPTDAAPARGTGVPSPSASPPPLDLDDDDAWERIVAAAPLMEAAAADGETDPALLEKVEQLLAAWPDDQPDDPHGDEPHGDEPLTTVEEAAPKDPSGAGAPVADPYAAPAGRPPRPLRTSAEPPRRSPEDGATRDPP